MVARRRRPKRRKKVLSVYLKWLTGAIALGIIVFFAYFLLKPSSKGGSDIKSAILIAYREVVGGKLHLNKTFDERANIVYKIQIPSSYEKKFIKVFKKRLPKGCEVKEITAGNEVLLKIDDGKEISKLLIKLNSQKRKKKEAKKNKFKYQYEEPLPQEGKKHKIVKKRKVKGQPLVAIIIDDCGLGHMESFEKALNIPYPITFAILPFRRYSKKCAYLANGKGYDVILHMPMEPVSYPKADPGPGAIFKTDRKKEIIKKLNRAFGDIRFAKGFNNHMGSAITQSRFAVRVILSYAEKHNKFFVDSRTTPYSVVEEEARKMGVKVLSRDVFLDNVIDYAHIKKQLNEVVEKAYKQGYAIAIGHNYPMTIEVLTKEMPNLDKRVNFVFVRELLNEK